MSASGALIVAVTTLTLSLGALAWPRATSIARGFFVATVEGEPAAGPARVTSALFAPLFATNALWGQQPGERERA